MSQNLISHSPDLKKLRDEGYNFEVRNGYLCISDIPYVNEKKELALGTLVTTLDLSGNITVKPRDHIVYFCGSYPCNWDGSPIESIRHSSQEENLSNGLVINHKFSSKPLGGYQDYYKKVTTYIKIIEHQAQVIDQSVSAKTFRPIREENAGVSPFLYLDTNSSRSEIGVISDKLRDLNIGIVGLGGTGSYVLDFVSKTPVREIHLFDADLLLQHNAFRMPGASAFQALNNDRTKKVDYFYQEYSKMRCGVVPHQHYVTGDNMDDVLKMSFVFICVDAGDIKRQIFQKLKEHAIPCIDVGIGINKVNTSLKGAARTTSITKEKRYFHGNISFGRAGDDDYSRGIQIAEINALNAALAVIKWKKMCGFYCDQANECESIYDISMNKVIHNNETGV